LNFSRDFLSDESWVGVALKIDVLTNLAADAFMCFRGCKRDSPG